MPEGALALPGGIVAGAISFVWPAFQGPENATRRELLWTALIGSVVFLISMGVLTSLTDSWIAGVIGGIAAVAGIAAVGIRLSWPEDAQPPHWIRWIWVTSMLAIGSMVVWALIFNTPTVDWERLSNDLFGAGPEPP